MFAPLRRMKRVISSSIPCHSRRKREADYSRGSTVCTIGAIGRRNGTSEIASDKRKANPRRTGCCRESSNVCVMGRVRNGYEADGIGREIRETRRESQNLKTRDDDELKYLRERASMARSPVEAYHRSLLIAAVALPHAGKCSRRSQTFDPPPLIAGRSRYRGRATFAEQSPHPKGGTGVWCANGTGMTHQVTVLEDGSSFEGKRYRSLSEVAREITGTRWSGPLFFGLECACEGATVMERR